MADLLTDLEQLTPELNDVGEAASALRGILSGVTGAIGGLKGMLGDLASAARSASKQVPKRDSKAASGSKAEDPLKNANESANRLIGKKAALKDVLGGALGNAASAASAAGGPLGAIADRLQSIAGIAGKVPPHLLVILAAVTALTAGLAAAAAAAAALGHALFTGAQAAVELIGQRSQLLAYFNAWAGASGGAGALAMVDKLSASLPIARDKIEEWARSLVAARITGAALERAVVAIASAQALAGESGAAATKSFLEAMQRNDAAAKSLVATIKSGTPESKAKLAEMGLTVQELAATLGVTTQQLKNMRLTTDQAAKAVEAALKKKGASPLQEMALTLPVMWAKFKENLTSLLSGLAPVIKPFMAAVKGLFDQFGKGTPVMAELRKAATAIFGEIFKGGTSAVGAVSKWIREHVTAKNIVGIWRSVVGAFRGARAAFMDAVATVRSIWGVFLKFLPLIKLVTAGLVALAAPVIVVAAAIAALATAGLVFMAAVAAIVGAITGAIAVIGGSLIDAIATAKDAFSQGWDSAGGSIISGLVAGVKAGASAFIGALTSMASQGLAAFKGVFGIASPSKVMLEHGDDNIAGAAATGIDKGGAKVDKALEGLGAGAGKAGAKVGAKVGGAGKSLVFNNCNFTGVTEALIREWIGRYLDETAAEAPLPEGA